ncbi:MAG: hypothetical protein MUF34_28855 [Polyangiaceae bacterium]|jgi:hypothetical protein|nr:hypothetical protein [Polyangiaceae bacterium]
MAARNDIHNTLSHADALATQGEGNNQTTNLGPPVPPRPEAQAPTDRDVLPRPGVETPGPRADETAKLPEVPTSPGVEVPKKARADWTLPPHLRESFPWQPKGGRAPRPTKHALLVMAAGPSSAAPLVDITPPPSADSKAASRAAGLHHVDDQRPGLRRVRWRLSFRIVDPGGTPVRDVATLARIKALGLLQPLDPTVTAGREAMVDRGWPRDGSADHRCPPRGRGKFLAGKKR